MDNWKTVRTTTSRSRTHMKFSWRMLWLYTGNDLAQVCREEMPRWVSSVL